MSELACPPDHKFGPPIPSVSFKVNPQPVNGDAPFGVLLGYQHQSQDERLQGVGLDKDSAQLVPLMLSLARLSARATVQETN